MNFAVTSHSPYKYTLHVVSSCRDLRCVLWGPGKYSNRPGNSSKYLTSVDRFIDFVSFWTLPGGVDVDLWKSVGSWSPLILGDDRKGRLPGRGVGSTEQCLIFSGYLGTSSAENLYKLNFRSLKLIRCLYIYYLKGLQPIGTHVLTFRMYNSSGNI